MNIYDDKRAYMVLLRSEHRDVNEILCHISTLVWQLGDPITNDSRLAQVVEHLAHLRQELKNHFLVEESGGCLDEAVARRPSIGREVDTIKGEQPRLMEQLEALINQATRIAEGSSEQSDFSQQWERFVAEMSNHEDAEDRLLVRGLENVLTEV